MQEATLITADGEVSMEGPYLGFDQVEGYKAETGDIKVTKRVPKLLKSYEEALKRIEGNPRHRQSRVRLLGNMLSIATKMENNVDIEGKVECRKHFATLPVLGTNILSVESLRKSRTRTEHTKLRLLPANSLLKHRTIARMDTLLRLIHAIHETQKSSASNSNSGIELVT